MAPQIAPIRVLVVDDDEMSRELLCVLLEAEGYAATSAESGEAALTRLHAVSAAPGVVLADVQMPGISGAELARKLRRACGPATLLLAMSGSQPPADAISRFDGFLIKPFKIKEVATALVSHRAPPKKLPAAAEKIRRSKAPRTVTKGDSPATSSPAGSASKNLLSIAASAEQKASNLSMNAVPMYARDPPPSQSNSIDNSTSAVPVLNEQIYQRLVGAMPMPQLKEMYALCVNDARQRIAGMRKFAAEHDDARFMREAHAIKGGCGMLGATELHRMAAELEAHGLEANAQQEHDVNSLDELCAACDRLERMLGSRV